MSRGARITLIVVLAIVVVMAITLIMISFPSAHGGSI
jgi:hypothetical protein